MYIRKTTCMFISHFIFYFYLSYLSAKKYCLNCKVREKFRCYSKSGQLPWSFENEYKMGVGFTVGVQDFQLNGFHKLRNCHPHWLIVGNFIWKLGSLTIVWNKLTTQCCFVRPETQYHLNSYYSCNLWLAGNVWVYGSHSDLSTNSASVNYCHPTAYYFAFWVITACYIIIGLVILLSCCCCIALCFCGKKE